MNHNSPPLVTALVTGVGAIIGQGIVKSLRSSCYSVKIIGIDKTDLSIGASFCDVFFKKPDCDETHPKYQYFWRQILESEKVDIVFPGLEVDVFFLDQQRDLLIGAGISVVLNRTELIAFSYDKWFLSQTLQQHGWPRIPSAMPENWREALSLLGPPPLLLKPRNGNGSRGIVRLHDESDFAYWRSKAGDNWMLQRIVGSDSDEYTVGAFGFGNGQSMTPIVFRRRLSSTGSTLQAQVVNDPAIDKMSTELTQLFKPLGPTNYQFRKENDIPYLLEINPRFSSSNSLRTAFGYNEAEMSIDTFLFGKHSAEPKIRMGTAWRYCEDFVRYDRYPV